MSKALQLKALSGKTNSEEYKKTHRPLTDEEIEVFKDLSLTTTEVVELTGRARRTITNFRKKYKEENGLIIKPDKVIQFDKQGNKIKTWGSAKEAGNALNIQSNNILKCCRGKAKTTGGYQWKFAE